MAHRDIHSWRAWYADGTRYNSKEHVWRELPEVGCVLLLVYLQSEWAPGKKYRCIHDCTDLIGINLDLGIDHQIPLEDWTGSVERGLIFKAVEEYPETVPADWKLGVGMDTNAFVGFQAEAVAAEDAP